MDLFCDEFSLIDFVITLAVRSFELFVSSNLDPFNRHIDQEIWRALEKCHIKDIVSILSFAIHVTCVQA
jgi:hypothetical protein